MKLTLNVLEKRSDDEEDGAGRATSSAAGCAPRRWSLIVAFLAVWWVYDTYQPQPPAHKPPATQVVPPGFVPDPNYTWVPRSRVQQPPD